MPPALGLGLGLSYRGSARSGFVPTYLLRDVFTTNAAAPITSPRTCEPGPGTLTLAQAAPGQWSIVSNKFTVASVGASEPRAVSVTSFNRVAGRAFMGTVGLAVGVISRIGWDTGGALPETHAFSLSAGGDLAARISGSGLFLGITTPTGVDHDCALVLRSAGAFYLVKNGGTVPNWTLAWVDNVDVSATLPVKISAATGTALGGTFDDLQVFDFPAPWTSDFGIATSRTAGNVPSGTVFTHTANCLIEYVQATLGAGESQVLFRRQDVANHWFVSVNAAGDLILNERVGGGANVRATAAAVVAAGHRVVVVADGTIIRGFSNNVLRWTYSSATNFQTATAGETALFAGTQSNLTAWPRTPNFPVA